MNRDEYRRTAADAIGGQAFIYYFYFLALGNAIAYFLVYRNPLEVATYCPMIIAFFSIILIGIVNLRTLHADLPQYDVNKLSTEERQGRPLNPLVWGLGVALLSTLFGGLADHFNLPASPTGFHLPRKLPPLRWHDGPLCQSSPVCHCLSAKIGSRFCQEKIRT